MKIISARARKPTETLAIAISRDQIIEARRCQEDPIYFMRKYLKIDLYAHQERALASMLEFQQLVINTPRQAGLTTLMAAYATWHNIFKPEETVVVVQPNMIMCRNMAQLVASYLQKIPEWLKGRVVVCTMGEIVLDNGARTLFRPVGPAATLGISPDVLLLGDVGYYNKYQAELFWAATAPIALAHDVRLVAWSTPSTTDNLFWKMWSRMDQYSINAGRILIDWRELSHLTDDRVERIQETLGLDVWKNEYLCEPRK